MRNKVRRCKVGMDDSFKVTDYIEKDKWSEFVRNHPKGNIFQAPEMMEVYKRTKRYEPIFVAVVDESDNVKAMLLAHIIREFDGFLGSFSARSIIQGGPLYVEDENGIAAVKRLMEHYDKIARKKVLYTEIRNMWDTSNISNLLKDTGYEYIEILNFLVDLRKPKEELWSNLSKKRRNGIRRAEKRGVIVKEVEDKSLIPVFYDLIRDTYANAKLPLADLTLFESAFNILTSKNMVKSFLAMHEDKNIGTIVVLMYNGVVYDWYAGASRDYLQLCPNDILPWRVMEWGSDNGHHTFDFGGAGSPNKEFGVRDFKKQFGGQLVNFGRYKKIHSPKKLWLAEKGFEIWRRLML